MYYLYQIGTDMFYYGCIYFFQIILIIICNVLNIDTPITNKLVLLAFTGMLLPLLLISTIKKKMKLYNKKETASLFHPHSSFRQRCSYLMVCILFALHICLSSIILFFEVNGTILVSISNSLSIIALVFTLLLSLFQEALPDKNDTILFDEDCLYYYMRVKKDSKNNQAMNIYIIPYDAITKSYINKNKLYIEYNRNHPKLKINRQFTTDTRRIVIDFVHYPQIKSFIREKDNVIKLKIKKYTDIVNSNYI